jgi:hypothetical protein
MKKIRRKPKKYSPEFIISVIMGMRENHMGYKGTMRKYFLFFRVSTLRGLYQNA